MLPSRETRQTELGVEVKCSKCKEFWPADKEFFYFGSDGRPHSWCKACYFASDTVVEKRERFKEKQREGRPPRLLPGRPMLDFGPLLEALG